METLITVLLTLSVTLNVVIMGIFGIAYKQWKKGQKSKSSVEQMFEQWGNK